MTDKQPDALRLADALIELDAQFSFPGACGEAAAELRRLHKVNAELMFQVGVLRSHLLGMRMEFGEGETMKNLEAALHAEAALAKATGENND